MAVFFLHTMFPQIFSGLPFVLLHILSPERTAFGFFNLIQVKNQCLTVYIPALRINDLCKLLYDLCPPYTAVTAIQITMFPIKMSHIQKHLKSTVILPLQNCQIRQELSTVIMKFQHFFHQTDLQHFIIRNPFTCHHLIWRTAAVHKTVLLCMFIHIRAL